MYLRGPNRGPIPSVLVHAYPIHDYRQRVLIRAHTEPFVLGKIRATGLFYDAEAAGKRLESVRGFPSSISLVVSSSVLSVHAQTPRDPTELDRGPAA
jgi:hypothetical protein